MISCAQLHPPALPHKEQVETCETGLHFMSTHSDRVSPPPDHHCPPLLTQSSALRCCKPEGCHHPPLHTDLPKRTPFQGTQVILQGGKAALVKAKNKKQMLWEEEQTDSIIIISKANLQTRERWPRARENGKTEENGRWQTAPRMHRFFLG